MVNLNLSDVFSATVRIAESLQYQQKDKKNLNMNSIVSIYAYGNNESLRKKKTSPIYFLKTA